MSKKPATKKLPLAKRNPLELTKEETRKLWAEEERLKEWKARQERPAQQDTGNSYVDDRRYMTEEEKETKDAWNKLIAEAKVRFPESLADRFSLAPTHKIAALAELFGWTRTKIASAAGVSEKTIRRWLGEPSVKAFQEAVEYYTGSKDGAEMLEREIYPSLMVLKDIRDNPESPASVRTSIAQWFYESKYGKAKEHREVTGFSIKDLTKEVRELRDKAKEELLEDVEIDELADTFTDRN